jgi:hypothetical protein
MHAHGELNPPFRREQMIIRACLLLASKDTHTRKKNGVHVRIRPDCALAWSRPSLVITWMAWHAPCVSLNLCTSIDYVVVGDIKY